MNLLIVESPNKIKKIKAVLGVGWEVAPSVGHISDLPGKELGIDKENGYKMNYTVYADKQEVVDKLQRLVGQVGKPNVYLATDPDREGEAIAFHLCRALALDIKTTKRVTFQEITEGAIRAAIAAPRVVDLKLVAAQESRRAIDRLVGFQVSPMLWRKLESGLSAGRVQSVATRLCVAREREIQGFIDRAAFPVGAVFTTPRGEELKARRVAPLPDESAAKSYLLGRAGISYQVVGVTTEPVSQQPPPAYSTSGLQQDGVKKLRMTVKRVSEVAQRLFEAGHITYIRTDSVNLGDTARAEAQAQITLAFGAAYHQERTFKNKDGAQEAHEAIRPTHWECRVAGDTDEEQRLYALIYARALASQMAAARFDQTVIQVGCTQEADPYTSTARVLTFDGYRKVYQEAAEDGEGAEGEEGGNLLRLGIVVGDSLGVQQIAAKQTYARPPKRYDEATLVAELEKKQIGRPSTYASILGVIQTRQYVASGDEPGKKVPVVQLVLRDGALSQQSTTQTLGADKAKLLPTARGTKLTAFLEANFADIMDYQFTAECENQFDEVAAGRMGYRDVVPVFDATLLQSLQTVQTRYPDLPPAEQRLLGQYEGNPITVGSNKFGTFVLHMGQHYNLHTYKPEQVSLPQAIEVIARKRASAVHAVGEFQGKSVSVGSNERGAYVVWEKQYFPLAEGQTAATLTVTQAQSLIRDGLARAKEVANRPPVATIGKFTIREGDKGLFVSDGKERASLHKDVTLDKAKSMTEEQCRAIIKKWVAWKKANSKEQKK